MYEDLKGKTALITGAGKKTGMGYAIAQKLASLGAHIVIADLGAPDPANPIRTGVWEEMAEIAREIADRHGVRTLAIGVDITSTEKVQALIAEVHQQFEGIDILVNNAGAAFGVPNALHQYPEDAWFKTIDINLHGTFRMSQACVPLMVGRQASIINTASRAGKVGPIFNGAYAVAKAGVIMLTKVMAKELGGAGIRVNAICPGQIMTDLEHWQFDLEAKFFNQTVAERQQEVCREIPLGRIGEVEDIANLVTFLASETSRYITGQALNICGGQLMEL
jgi:NAD(P)-dependent dehydrogenase (short-subunit alcohol dehydrogenase family)